MAIANYPQIQTSMLYVVFNTIKIWRLVKSLQKKKYVFIIRKDLFEFIYICYQNICSTAQCSIKCKCLIWLISDYYATKGSNENCQAVHSIHLRCFLAKLCVNWIGLEIEMLECFVSFLRLSSIKYIPFILLIVPWV